LFTSTISYIYTDHPPPVGVNRCAGSFYIGDFYSLSVSLVFTLSATRRFPTEELVALTVFITGFSIASC